MGGEKIGAPVEEGRPARVLEDERCRIAVVVLGGDLVSAWLAPGAVPGALSKPVIEDSPPCIRARTTCVSVTTGELPWSEKSWSRPNWSTRLICQRIVPSSPTAASRPLEVDEKSFAVRGG